MSTWSYSSLDKVCYIKGGGTPSKSNEDFYKGDIPWATVRDMNHDLIKSTQFKITDEAVRKSSTNIIPHDNVIIATRVGLGKVCLIKQATAINQDLRAIIPKDTQKLSVSFLYWWFKSISHVIESEGTGATVKGVKLPFIKSLSIPLPNPSEQKQIVSILDQAFKDIDQAIANTERNLTNARELFESYSHSVFMKREGNWTERPLGDICKIKHGFAFKSKHFSDNGKHVLLTPGSFYESGGYRDRGNKTKFYNGEIPDGFILEKDNFRHLS